MQKTTYGIPVRVGGGDGLVNGRASGSASVLQKVDGSCDASFLFHVVCREFAEPSVLVQKAGKRAVEVQGLDVGLLEDEDVGFCRHRLLRRVFGGEQDALCLVNVDGAFGDGNVDGHHDAVAGFFVKGTKSVENQVFKAVFHKGPPRCFDGLFVAEVELCNVFENAKQDGERGADDGLCVDELSNLKRVVVKVGHIL